MTIIIILILFLIILLLFKPKNTENFKDIYDCPVLLVKILDKFFAYYPNSDQILRGSNPIIFNSIKDYKNYMDFQKSKGLYCPFLNANDESKLVPTEKIFSLKSGKISKKVLEHTLNKVQ